jgi:hypothetical protein
MNDSYTKPVKNYIQYNNKPFTTKQIADETGFDLLQVKRVIAALLKKEAIKAISKDGKYKIYIKNPDFKEEPVTNDYGYNYRMMKKMYNLIKNKKVSSSRKLEEMTGFHRRAILRYLKAFASMKMITLELGYYKVINFKPDFALVGKKVEDDILIVLRENDSGGKMAKREKVLKDADGREYHAKIIDPQLVKRDTVVNRVMKRAFRLHTKIMDEKDRITSDIDRYLSQTAEQYGENWKGNAELISFDGKYKIEVRHRERIEFSEKLQIAKQKIDECLKRWTEDSNINLQAVVLEAFQVDKKGEIAKSRILGLRRYNIKDEQWKQAMDLIDEAIQITSTKQYIAFYERPANDKPFRLISLNFSAI